MTTKETLLPCPFCGSEAEIITLDGEDGDVGIGAQCVQCAKCGTSSSLIFPLMDDVTHLLIERWNRRAEQQESVPTEQSEREAFEEFVKNEPNYSKEDLKRPNGIVYGDRDCRLMWNAWQARAQSVPEGFVLVPIEPTIEMMDDAFENISLSDAHTTYGVTEHVWAYMLSKAPSPKE